MIDKNEMEYFSTGAKLASVRRRWRSIRWTLSLRRYSRYHDYDIGDNDNGDLMISVCNLICNFKISVCNAAWRGGEADNVDLSLAQVGHHQKHRRNHHQNHMIITITNLILHSDMFGRNDFLGEVMLPMSGQLFDDPSSQWFSLQDRVWS